MQKSKKNDNTKWKKKNMTFILLTKFVGNFYPSVSKEEYHYMYYNLFLLLMFSCGNINLTLVLI